jgi:CheY-like chemotaxis protein
VAATGREAVEIWERGGVDLVLMDVQMPEMNGREATRIIREKERDGRHTCIIGLTAHALPEIRKECLAAGMDRVLTKPVKVRDLHSTINECLAEQGCGRRQD